MLFKILIINNNHKNNQLIKSDKIFNDHFQAEVKKF